MSDAHVHDYFGAHEHSVKHQTGRASLLLVGTLMGGVLIVSSFLAGWFFKDPLYGQIVAGVGAVLLTLPIVVHSVKHLMHGHMHMDELVAVALVAAIAIEEYQTAGVVAFFFHISILIEQRTALGARASIESLIKLTPTRAHLIAEDGTETQVDARQLQPGQIIRVRPGDNVPADGEVLSGESSISEANITGESMPVDKRPGDEVFSGTSNISGALDIRVSRAGADTTLGRVQNLILQAEQTKIPVMRLIDRFAGWYTPVVLMLAAVVLIFTGQWDRAITMLVVACPCAIILATPTAMVASLACAARLGILIKSVGDLENARRITAIIFDKTGTLTTGKLAVTRLRPAPNVEPAELLTTAASAEQLSKHPVAQAITSVAREARLDLNRPDEFNEISGVGVEATISGKKIFVGRRRLMERNNIDVSFTNQPEYNEPEGLSTLYVAVDGRCLGWIGFEDRTRSEARQAMDDLRHAGVKRLLMVTGDRWGVARRVAAEMGCSDVQAEVLPQQKLELVDTLKREGHSVAVVGDGVNDAPALAAGDLGVAMGAAGSDVAINSASIALMNNDLSRLPFIVRLSRETIKVVWQNLIFGIVFIVALFALAGLGLVGAVLGVILHTGGSALVVFNSARLVRFGEYMHHETAAREPERKLPRTDDAPDARTDEGHIATSV